METLILVDEQDNQIGTEEKMQTHFKGLLHRCFSIFIFNSSGKILLQKRAAQKYHSAGLWANTCCSHPRPEESDKSAAQRRLQEEMGFSTNLQEIHTFTYKAKLDHGLTEHEFDHVMAGRFDGEPRPDPKEVDGYRWLSIEELKAEVARYPERFAIWLKLLTEDHVFLKKAKEFIK
ncbi:MAG: isopentenyl-diphosphate Delta-isomerase [bacterium]|nr:isopentenyl-diphosphate Delta-isomerase [bacterium]